MADDNKPIKYIRYAIGEIALVVIGILIALQINNWNESRKTDITRMALLNNLVKEFNFNKTELKRVMTLNSSNAQSALELTNNMSAEISTLSDEECGKLITGSLIAEVQYRPSTGAINEILSSGQLSIFKTDTLKTALASWDGNMLKIRFQEQEHQNFRLKALDMVHSEGNLKRLYFQNFKSAGSLKDSRFTQENLEILKNVEFENLMSSFYMTALFLNKPYYSGLEGKIDTILELIEKELNL